MLEGSALCPGIWILDVRPCPKGCEAQWGVGPRHPHLPESAAESGGAVKRLASGPPRRRARQVCAGPRGAHCAAPPAVPSQAPGAHLRERWAAERAVPPDRGHALKGTCARQRPHSKGNLCLCPAPQWPSSHLHSPLDHQELWRNIFPAPQAVGLAMAALAAVAQAAAFKALVCSGSALVPQWPAGRRCAQHPRQPLRAGPGAERARPPPVTQPRGSSARPSDCSA